MSIYPKYETSVLVESGVSYSREAEAPQPLPLWMGVMFASVVLGSVIYLLVRVPRMLADILKFYEEDEPVPESPLPPLPFTFTPCKQCHYYTSSLYLKCAVHPSKVLTKQAIDCPDYRPCTSVAHPTRGDSFLF